MPDPLSPERIAALYEAAGEPDALRRMAAIVQSVMDTETAGIWLVEEGRVCDLTVTDDIAASTAPYLAYYHRIDPWSAARRQPGRVFLGPEQVDEDMLLRSEFYNDFARHYGMRRPMGLAMPLEPGIIGTVSVNRAAGSRLLDVADKDRLADLGLHLGAALRLHRRFRAVGARGGEAADALDALAFGIVVCGPNGRVRRLNRAAEDLARAGAGLALGPRGALAAASPGESADLRALVQGAAAGRPGAMRLRGKDGIRLSVLATPLGAGRAAPSALLTLRRDDAPAAPAPALLQRLFGLTPAQAALCGQLAAGLTFEEAAAARGVAVSTARTHFLGILARTGTQNLRDLLRLLGTLPPLAG
ncbi:helix-turn-helix transcriptional regulator [Methylobacterium segetis]|uniref:helix-turn-helix transcriptional regulator n=1 Tax=Methylobacterium segetis TaxID=2488750 RepID=UPI00104882DB|nr:PAS domain-containing protein [Methylobacterium segetis]